MIKTTLMAITMTTALLAAPMVNAQAIVRADQLESLRAELGDVGERVKRAMIATSESMGTLENFTGNERTEAAYALLDQIEAETRIILETVKLNSPFMNSLDATRANVVTILRKHEREPQSAARDSRIARLVIANDDIEAQYREIQGVERKMIRLLADHARMRREIQLDAGVEAVETFVSNLGQLTAELQAMTNVLAEVSTATVDTSETAPIAQD